MPKATITVDEQPQMHEVRDEWDGLARALGERLADALAVTPRPERITIDFAGMSMTEWNALPEETRRDLQEYGADG